MATNNFLTFCPTDTGTNLLDEATYTAATGRISGNVPGIASSQLNNKALRQANAVTSQVAQMACDITGADLLDNGLSDNMLGVLKAALNAFPPVVNVYTSGTGTFNPTYIFFIAVGNATASATYTNNGNTFTVVSTISSGKILQMTGPGLPSVEGTLTKATGTGDATITFYAVKAPTYLYVEVLGGGGGGGGGGAGASDGGTGGTTSFGALTANGGNGGSAGGGGGLGGTVSGTSSVSGLSFAGSVGLPAGSNASGGSGGSGGCSPYGGAGAGPLGGSNGNGYAAATNSGSGGGGCSRSGASGGGGGAAGGFIKGQIFSYASTYTYGVGAAGTAGTGAQTGGAGGAGSILVIEYYQ